MSQNFFFIQMNEKHGKQGKNKMSFMPTSVHVGGAKNFGNGYAIYSIIVTCVYIYL